MLCGLNPPTGQALHCIEQSGGFPPNSPNIGQTNFDDSYKMVKLNDSKPS